ncbi:Mfa1 family fimbria major subunit [Parabacteroides sp. PF5-6]|uniref:Mfa1 family fimbria major subunit n=1 Tax=Parabacteroides sp. PF5-6 TaxID=1742403 RepID=UPI002407734A|nr:Mfa1 family fimbria major subunit [Parabacteroides sp. PF5-6]MDF9829764.1 hypothetical protein [Parabacteroides sp. PF5-6]
MKTKQLKSLTVCALMLAMGLTACSHDKDELIVPPAPETGSLSIAFRANELTTRALDKTATSLEKELKTVHAFIYKANKTLEKVAVFSVDDFTKSGDSYALKTGHEIEGLEGGAKEVALGINLPATLVGQIQGNGSTGMTSAYNLTVAELSDPTNGYVMFSDIQPAQITAGSTTTVSNPFGVDRIVAKLSVKTKPGISMKVAGGRIDGITYNVQNINKEIYPVAPTLYKSETIDRTVPANYIAVDPVPEEDTPVADTQHTYMTEYKPVLPLADDSYPTYVRIRCTFIPTHYVTDADGKLSTTESAGGDFWTLPLKDGAVAYFVDKDMAQAYFNNVKNAGKIFNPETKEFEQLVVKYAEGKVDYGVFLHKTANKFDVVRNNYYMITITAINGLGEPSGKEQIDPKEKGDLVSFDLVINDWEGVEADDEQIS